MSPLIHQRCWTHPSREAAVRCPSCGRFYCRECATEHDGRMFCAACVAKIETGGASGQFHTALWSGFALAGFLLAWLIFYELGLILARIPSDFFSST